MPTDDSTPRPFCPHNNDGEFAPKASDDATREEKPHHRLGRRGFLKAGTTATVGLSAAALAACSNGNGGALVATTSQSVAPPSSESDPEPTNSDTDKGKSSTSDLSKQTVPFDGTHQAGIVSPSQAYMTVIGLNVTDGMDVDKLKKLFRVWTLDARALTQGHSPLADLEPEMDSTPANLTITLGIGRPLLAQLGLEDKAPSWLHDIPAFTRDQLQDQWGQTDLALQFCCDDPTTLAHAIRYILREGRSYARPQWTQQGFLYAAGTQPKGSTPRNLFGTLDGTVNPRTPETQKDIVWINEGPKWMHNGTAMVIRRISLDLDRWDILDRSTRETVFGRKLDTGAPLTGTKEFDTPDFQKTDDTGLPIIDPDSHIARAHYRGNNTHEQILRRAYNYDLPVSGLAHSVSDSGLIFTCFQQNPDTQFTPIQKRLDESDRLNEWSTHIGSAVYACPPGTKDDTDFWGSDLFS